MKDIVCYDIESTGLSTTNDYIIQLSCMKIDPVSFKEKDRRNWYILPQHAFEITPGAFEAHGITKEFLMNNGVKIKDIAEDFIQFIDNCDFLTYNGNSFDIQFLVKDFKLAGYDIDLKGRKFYDSFAMEAKLNPRTLSAVYNKYVGKPLENAHDSMSDVEATVEVFKAQLANNEATLEEVSEWNENQLLSPEGSIRMANKEPKLIVFSKGKYRDVDFMEVFKNDRNYVDWFFKNVATSYTIDILRDYYKERMSNNS